MPGKSSLWRGLPAIGILLFPTTAGAVKDGHLADTGDFPSVVLLKGTRQGVPHLCTGVYVGGRVLLTAGHCFDNFGFRLYPEELYEYTGQTPSTTHCDSDLDCPALTLLGVPTPLECVADYGFCVHPDPLLSNLYTEALFGEGYEPHETAHPQNSLRIDYCRPFTAYEGDSKTDFAYCILREAPDLQPVPTLSPCEVDLYWDAEHDLPTLTVGFGYAGEGAQGEPGRKRWAQASTLGLTVESDDSQISYGLWNFDPGPPQPGDSGSPLLVQLPVPEETWRVGAITVKPFTGVPAWKFREWMLEDPQVDAAAVFPCLDAQGEWSPTAGCGAFPKNPQLGMGEWSSAPLACTNPDVGGLESTCGPAFDGDPLPPPRGEDLQLPPDTLLDDPAPLSRGCAVASVESPRALLIPSALALLGLLGGGLRRRSSRRMLLSMLALCLSSSTACTDDGVGGGDDEIGAEGSEPGEPLVLNPQLHHTHSGILLEGAGYDQLAVGHVVRAVGEVGCCEDIVLAGAANAEVELRFGGGSTERGLTFLAERSPQLYSMANPGEGLLDVTLADVDADGRNDLLALTTGGELAVRLGKAPGPEMTYFGPVQRYGANTGSSGLPQRFIVGSIDCDEDLDVVLTAPNGPGVLLLPQTQGGAFGSASFVETPYEHNIDENLTGGPVDVAIGDFDGEGAPDLVTVNDNGTLTFYRKPSCGGGPDIENYEVFFSVGDCFGCISNARESHVLTNDFYCGTPHDDVAVSVGDSVLVYCNEDNLVNLTPLNWTYRWDVNDTGHPGPSDIDGLYWWVPNQALYALTGRHLRRLPDPGKTSVQSTPPRVLTTSSGTLPENLKLTTHTGISEGWWDRVIWIGATNNDTSIGFFR